MRITLVSFEEPMQRIADLLYLQDIAEQRDDPESLWHRLAANVVDDNSVHKRCPDGQEVLLGG